MWKPPLKTRSTTLRILHHLVLTGAKVGGSSVVVGAGSMAV